MIKVLGTREAIAELQRLEGAGAELYGLEGFTLHADGCIEPLMDLIFDFTTTAAPSTPTVGRFAEASRFITANDGPYIRWDIASGTPEE